MKYFTRELWEAGQGDDRDQFASIWQKNLRNYERQLQRLRPRLTANAFKFFTRESLHDGSLLAVHTVDESASVDSTRKGPQNRRYPTAVTISACNDRYVYTLSYSQVRKIAFEFPPEKRLFREAPEGFGWWGYDELTSRGKYFLGHDILFDSGAIISLEFKSVNVRRKRA